MNPKLRKFYKYWKTIFPESLELTQKEITEWNPPQESLLEILHYLHSQYQDLRKELKVARSTHYRKEIENKIKEILKEIELTEIKLKEKGSL